MGMQQVSRTHFFFYWDYLPLHHSWSAPYRLMVVILKKIMFLKILCILAFLKGWLNPSIKCYQNYIVGKIHTKTCLLFINFIPILGFLGTILCTVQIFRKNTYNLRMDLSKLRLVLKTVISDIVSYSLIECTLDYNRCQVNWFMRSLLGTTAQYKAYGIS